MKKFGTPTGAGPGSDSEKLGLEAFGTPLPDGCLDFDLDFGREEDFRLCLALAFALCLCLEDFFSGVTFVFAGFCVWVDFC